jgi:hypothetical protein
MVNYSDSKAVYVGKLNGIILPENIFVTTLKPSQFLADLKRKYRDYIKSSLKSKNIPIFDIITKEGIDNIIINILKQVAVNNKQELNELLQITKNEYLPINLLIAKNKTMVSNITTTRYEANLKIIMKKMNIDNVKYFYENPNDVITAIDNLPLSLATKKNYLKSISSIIPTENPLKNIYGNQLTLLSSQEDDIRNEQVKNPDIIYKNSNTLNKVTLDLVKKNSIQNAVISIFYSGFYLPVFRIKEVITMKWKNYNILTDNYISFDTNEFILNDYKTVKMYQQQKVKFPDYVKDLMLKLIRERNNQDTDYLLLKDKKPFNESEFSKKVTDIFDVNVNNLRSMYITGKFNDGLINTENDKIKLAKDMRNSPDVFRYYIKFDENKQPIKFV